MPPKKQKQVGYPYRRGAANPHVFLEIGITGVGSHHRGGMLDPTSLRLIGRIEIELFVHEYPTVADNFRALCTGERGIGVNGKPLHFLGSRLHKIVPGCITGGDIIYGTGQGGESIYGPEFTTSGIDMERSARVKPQPGRDVGRSADVGPGAVTAVSLGTPYTYSSQFRIWSTPHRETKNVVFGRISRGFPVVKEIEKLGSVRSGCVMDFVIANCGMAASIYSPLPVPPSLIIPKIYPSDAVIPPMPPMVAPPVAPPMITSYPSLPQPYASTYYAAAPAQITAPSFVAPTAISTSALPQPTTQPLLLTYYQEGIGSSGGNTDPITITSTSQHYSVEQLEALKKLNIQ